MDIEKNDFTKIRIEKRTWQGRDFIDIRQYFKDDEDKYKPSAKGITIPPERLPELIAALETLNHE